MTNPPPADQTIRPSKKIEGVFSIERPTFADDRGFFREYFRLNDLEAAVGRPLQLVQANHSHSIQKVLRGVHLATFDKLIYVTSGRVLIGLIDLRPESPTFRQRELIEIGDTNRQTFFLPPGIGNSYYVLSPTADYLYLVGAYYDPAKEQTLRWNDSELGFAWPDDSPILSDRDTKTAKSFAEIFPHI